MPVDQPAKQRNAFTDVERQNLRSHHQKYPSTSPRALASWFELQFGRKIGASSVYDILSDKYAYLDASEASHATRKQRAAQLPELEDALFKWWQEAQPRHVNRKELKDKANEIWHTIPTCQGTNRPAFSDGWLTKWRNRYGLGKPKDTSDPTSSTHKPNSIQLQIPADVLSIDFPLNHPITSFYPVSMQSSIDGLNFPWRQISPAVPNSSTSQHVQMGVSHAKDEASILAFKPGQAVLKRKMSTDLQTLISHQAKRRRTGNVSWRNTATRPDLFAHQSTSPDTFVSDIATRVTGLHESSASYDPNPWVVAGTLFSNYFNRTAADTILPADGVFKVFDPILQAAEEDFLQTYCGHSNSMQLTKTNRADFKKVIRLFKAAKNFRLLRCPSETQGTIIEDWLLDCICPERLRSQSPQPPEEERIDFTSLGQNSMTSPDVSRRQRP